jgi:hypothetical protein
MRWDWDWDVMGMRWDWDVMGCDGIENFVDSML